VNLRRFLRRDRSFQDDFALSTGESEVEDIRLITYLTGCVRCVKTPVQIDLTGIDYTATLADGAEIHVDVKTRRAGCSRFWRGFEPEIPIETWSVCESDTSRDKIGWTLDEKTNVDWILFRWHPDDTKQYFVVPFQHLRLAFKKHRTFWIHEFGPVKPQWTTKNGARWKSEVFFIPWSTAHRGINEVMAPNGGRYL